MFYFFLKFKETLFTMFYIYIYIYPYQLLKQKEACGGLQVFIYWTDLIFTIWVIQYTHWEIVDYKLL